MATPAAIALAALLAAAGPALPAGERSAAPPLILEVAYGAGGGPDRLRSEFQEAVLQELKRRACFPDVGIPPEEKEDPDALLLQIILETPEESIRSDRSLYGEIREEQDSGRRNAVATIRVRAVMQILLPGDRTLYRVRRLNGQASYRAEFSWENEAAEARNELITDLAVRVGRFACKAKAKLSG